MIIMNVVIEFKGRKVNANLLAVMILFVGFITIRVGRMVRESKFLAISLLH